MTQWPRAMCCHLCPIKMAQAMTQLESTKDIKKYSSSTKLTLTNQSFLSMLSPANNIFHPLCTYCLLFYLFYLCTIQFNNTLLKSWFRKSNLMQQVAWWNFHSNSMWSLLFCMLEAFLDVYTNDWQRIINKHRDSGFQPQSVSPCYLPTKLPFTKQMYGAGKATYQVQPSGMTHLLIGLCQSDMQMMLSYYTIPWLLMLRDPGFEPLSMWYKNVS